MTSTTKKTDRERLYYSSPLSEWSIFADGRESDFVAGMEAFAQEYFNEYSDETSLPDEFVRLAELVEETFGWDMDELLGREDDDADEEE